MASEPLKLSIERGANGLTLRLHQRNGDSDATAEDGDWLVLKRRYRTPQRPAWP